MIPVCQMRYNKELSFSVKGNSWALHCLEQIRIHTESKLWRTADSSHSQQWQRSEMSVSAL